MGCRGASTVRKPAGRDPRGWLGKRDGQLEIHMTHRHFPLSSRIAQETRFEIEFTLTVAFGGTCMGHSQYTSMILTTVGPTICGCNACRSSCPKETRSGEQVGGGNCVLRIRIQRSRGRFDELMPESIRQIPTKTWTRKYYYRTEDGLSDASEVGFVN